jgi:hypothetical protein
MMKAKIIAIFLLCMVAIVAQAAIYRILSTDLYVNGMPPNLTKEQKAKWLDQVNISETNAAIDANKYNPITTTNASKKVKELDKPVVVPPVVVVPTCTPPEVLNVITNKCELLPPPPIATTGAVAPPKVAVSCNEMTGTCDIPSGVTAKVWRGSGGTSGKWASKDNITGSIACSNAAIGDPQTGSYNRCFYVDNKLLAKDLDPKGQNFMPAVNKALVPPPAVGWSTAMIKPAAIPPLQSFPSGGAFRIPCNVSHMSNDDPIVYPDVPNATHHHTFFGNTKADAYSTNESLRNSGNSTCSGGILNRSGYWMPSLINTNTGAPVKPIGILVYYKAHNEYTGMHIKSPPPNLRMIAGNARPLTVADTQADYFCQNLDDVGNPAHWGIMWKGNHLKACAGPKMLLRMAVSFPDCWDGKNMDSPDHQSHMAYSCGDECLTAENKIGKTFNGCPATHPVMIPGITLNVDFQNLDPAAEYRLASDNYSTNYPGGYSLHADWMNGWDEGTIDRVVKNCLNNPRNCEIENLGDGQRLHGVND